MGSGGVGHSSMFWRAGTAAAWQAEFLPSMRVSLLISALSSLPCPLPHCRAEEARCGCYSSTQVSCLGVSLAPLGLLLCLPRACSGSVRGGRDNAALRSACGAQAFSPWSCKPTWAWPLSFLCPSPGWMPCSQVPGCPGFSNHVAAPAQGHSGREAGPGCRRSGSPV